MSLESFVHALGTALQRMMRAATAAMGFDCELALGSMQLDSAIDLNTSGCFCPIFCIHLHRSSVK